MCSNLTIEIVFGNTLHSVDVSNYTEGERKKLFDALCEKSASFIKELDRPPVQVDLDLTIGNVFVRKTYEVRPAIMKEFCSDKADEICDALSPMIRHEDQFIPRSQKVIVEGTFFSRGRKIDIQDSPSGRLKLTLCVKTKSTDFSPVSKVKEILEHIS